MSDYLSMTVIILLALIGGIVIGYQYRSYRCEHAIRRLAMLHAENVRKAKARGINEGICAQMQVETANARRLA